MKSTLGDLTDQLFWVAQRYKNLLEHITNLDTNNRLIGIIGKMMNNFEKVERTTLW